MKTLQKILIGICLLLPIASYAQLFPFTSKQLAPSPVNGYVLQTTGTSSKWVDFSTAFASSTTFVSFSYASSTFPSFTYASSTFPSFTYGSSTYVSFSYASSTYASTSGIITTYIPYTGGTSNVDLGVHNLTVDTSTFFLNATTHQISAGTTTSISLFTLETDNLTATPATTSGLLLINGTAAASTSQQVSPSIWFKSQGWGTTASATAPVEWQIYQLPVQGATPTNTLIFANSTNNSVFTTRMTLGNGGGLTLTGGLTIVGAIAGATTGAFSGTITQTTTALATTTNTAGINLTNTTAATAATRTQTSPLFQLTGTAAATSTSRSNAMAFGMQPQMSSTSALVQTWPSFYIKNTTVDGVADASEWLRISGYNGNIGAGSSSPIAKFTIVGTSTAATFGANNSTVPLFDVASSTNVSFFRINANGNIGVSSTSPATAFVVVGTTTTQNLAITNLTNTFLAVDPTGNVTATTTPLTTANASTLYVPYTGANASVDLGVNNLTTTGTTSSSGFLAGLGTVSRPTYSFTGDTNTGIWSTSSDIINFSTGGLQRMQIQGNSLGTLISLGNDLAGNTVPTYGIDMFPAVGSLTTSFTRIVQTGTQGITGAEYIGSRNDANTTFGARIGLGFRRSDGIAVSTSTQVGAIEFGGQVGATSTFDANYMYYAASVKGIAEGDYVDQTSMPTGLTFSTGVTGNLLHNFNVSYGTERMRITNAGNVGIGVTTPTNILSFGGTLNRKIWIEDSGIDLTGRNLTIAAGSATTGSAVIDRSGGGLILQAGVGTGLGASIINFQTGTPTVSGTTTGTMSTKMTILGNGSAGIGNIAPLGLLDVGGAISTSTPALNQGVFYNQAARVFTDTGTADGATNNGLIWNRFGQQQIAATNASTTYTNLFGTVFSGAPLANGGIFSIGTSTTLYIGSGAVSASTTKSYSLFVNAQTNATKNYSGIFIGGNFAVGTTTPSAAFEVYGTAGNNNIFNFASSSNALVYRLDSRNHFSNASTTNTTPTLSACGTNPIIIGDDKWGTVTGGATGNGCTLTFAKTYTNSPTCVVTSQTGSVVNTFSYAVTATTITVTETGLGTGKFDYMCGGQNEP